MKLLKRLAGSKWGSSRKTLNTTYNMYVKPTLTYCSEIMIVANESNKQSMEKVQNEDLRIVSGAVKTNPINSMYALTQNKPIMSTIEQQALIQYEKMIRLPNNSVWNNFTEHPNEMKTQPSFIKQVRKLKKEYKIPDQREILKHPSNPMDYTEIPHSLSLNQKFRKEDVAPSVAKVIAQDTIHEYYPPENWLHIYTDGSLQNTEIGAGAGVTCDLFSFYKGLGKYTTNFDGEVEAIKLATQQLLYRTHCFNQAVILSDSKAAIQAIISTSENTSDKIREVRAILKQPRQLGKAIAIQWVPAHCGLEGNEKADALAKKREPKY
uniref:RNase H type-1 domain-containing protein n=1 Tax=Cacopsylla melanoneura TaxID=428564 RepID=A0A8D9AVJ4_9HEMI